MSWLKVNIKHSLRHMCLLMLGILFSTNVFATAVQWSFSGTLDQLLDANGDPQAIANVNDYLYITGQFSYDASNLSATPNTTVTSFAFTVSDAANNPIYQFTPLDFEVSYAEDPTTSLPTLQVDPIDLTINNDALILQFTSDINQANPATLTYALFSRGFSTGPNPIVQYASSGIGQTVSPVPMPESVYLMLSGLFFMGCMVRRRG